MRWTNRDPMKCVMKKKNQEKKSPAIVTLQNTNVTIVKITNKQRIFPITVACEYSRLSFAAVFATSKLNFTTGKLNSSDQLST